MLYLRVSYLVCDLRGTHGIREVLLVGEDQEHGIMELVFLEHAMQLVTRLASAIAVIGVDHKDQALRVLEIVAPEWADLVLSTHIPHREADILVLNSLDVEACAYTHTHIYIYTRAKERQLSDYDSSGNLLRHCAFATQIYGSPPWVELIHIYIRVSMRERPSL